MMSFRHIFSVRLITGLLLIALLGQSLTAAEEIVPVPVDDWGQIHAGMVADAKARADHIQIVFIGDSITARWTRSPGEQIWGKDYAPLGAINLGISSDATQHVLWRLQHGVLEPLHPRMVILLVGTNNITAGTDPEAIAYGVWTIVAHLRHTLPDARVLVQAIFPRCDRPKVGEMVPKVNALLARLDDGKMVKFIDFGARFLGPDGQPDPAVFTDGIHPNKPDGFRIWNEAIQPVVREWLTAPPLHDIPPPLSPVAMPKDLTPATATARNEFIDRHNRILAAPASYKDRCRLLFLGDECMGAWRRVEPLFNREYGAYHPLNFSIEGARPENLLWQIANGELAGMHPALVVVHTQEALRSDTPVERIVAGMTEVVQQIREKLPAARILVLGAFPLGEHPDDRLRAVVARYNALLKPLADGGQVTVEDIGAAFLMPDGTCPKGTTPSARDFSEAAFTHWAEAQKSVITRLLTNP